jgi:branched-chain amino acid aminotransferase
MAQQYPEWIWQNGEIKPWKDATAHVMSHALHYGSSVFEGIRSYVTPEGAAIFRLTDHLKRLYLSAKIYDMVLPYSQDQLANACREVIRKNGFTAAYLRPVAYRGLGGFGLSAETPIDVAVASWPMGPYLGPEALEVGITACVSSWQRFAPNTIPAGAKAGGNYLSGQLIAREVLAKVSRLRPAVCSARVRAKTCSSCSMACCTPRQLVRRFSQVSRVTR